MESRQSKTESSLPGDFTRRIVVLGKTGAGKSSLINTLFGENVCQTDDSPTSVTSKCQTESRMVNGRSITFIDTPGLFDTKRSEEVMEKEIMKCIIESAPGPHVFLIVLRVDKYTDQEKEIINKIKEYFSDEALKFSTVLFTHGDQLSEGTTIEEFVSESEDLKELIKKCGNRCNVIDNKYWKSSLDGYRCNKFQVEKLFNTVDEIIEANGRGHYTNQTLESVNKELEEEEERLKNKFPNLSSNDRKEKAKENVLEKWLLYLLKIGGGAVMLLLLFLSRK